MPSTIANYMAQAKAMNLEKVQFISRQQPLQLPQGGTPERSMSIAAPRAGCYVGGHGTKITPEFAQGVRDHKRAMTNKSKEQLKLDLFNKLCGQEMMRIAAPSASLRKVQQA